MLGHRPTNAPGDTGGSMSRIKSGEFGRSLVVFHRFDPTLHACPLLAHTHDMNHSG